jgi:hypothetical protein
VFYDDGQPLHITWPEDSIIKSFTYKAWKALTPVQMQQELSKKNVIVTGWPLKEKVSFNKDGLRKVAGTQSRQISINGNIHVVNFSLNSLYVYFPDYSIKPSSNGCGCEWSCVRYMGQSPSIWENSECVRSSIIQW